MKLRNNIKRENIVKYWKDNIGEKEINTTWDNALTHCWACGIECNRLERAHIIPEGLGGAMTAENMVLLCLHCHGQNPETIYPVFFWLWMQGRKKLSETSQYERLYLPSIEQEYRLMFGEVDLELEKDIKIFFGAEICKQKAAEFFRFYEYKHIPRGTSTKAILQYKYNLRLKYLLSKYKLDQNDSDVLEFFPEFAGRFSDDSE